MFKHLKNNHLLSFVAGILLASTPHLSHAQQWQENLPQKSEAYTFYDYQKAFNAYWEPFQVASGYYFDANNVKHKAPGWKQFKRWEYYWSNRVDPKTGAFPVVNRVDLLRELNKDMAAQARGKNSGSWTSLGPSSSSGGYAGLGRINVVGFRTGDANTYYVGTPSGGLWKTINDGGSWTPLTDNTQAMGISDIIVINGSSHSSDTIFIGTGDKNGGSLATLNGQQAADNNGVGVMKSYDGGSSWSTTGLTFKASEGNRVSRMMLDPKNSRVMVVSVIGIYSNVGQVYKSSDRGNTFTQVSNNRFIDMEYKPGSSDTLYGATIDGQIWTSVNGGLAWNQININFGNKRVELAVTPAAPRRVYAIVNGENGLGKIWRSNDDGQTWATYFDGAIPGHNLLGYECGGTDAKTQGDYDLCIAADPTDPDKVYIGGINIWKSTNGGLNWSISTHWSSTCTNTVTTVHADQHFLGFNPATGHLFAGNDGGLYRTENHGSSWLWKGDGLAIGQIYRLGLSDNDASRYITGLQDNGSKSTDANNWSDRIGGDGMECIIDPTNDNTQYCTGPSGQIYKTTNNWGSNTDITLNIPVNINGVYKGSWVTPYVLHPGKNDTIYVGYKDLWRSTNGGASFSAINNWPQTVNPNPLQSIAIADSMPNHMYVADNDSIHKTENGGASWALVTSNLPVDKSYITYIAVHPKHPDTVWVSMGQYNEHGVYQSYNGGTSWTNISLGLPNIPVMSVVHYQRNEDTIILYAATDVGVYVKYGAANWASYNGGLPNVVVSELEIYYSAASKTNDKLRAASFGRGLWESPMADATTKPIPDFTVDNQYPSTGETITLTDLSSEFPNKWKWKISPSTGVAFVNGTADNVTNPQLTFANQGNYEVRLVVENIYGKDSLTRTNYIHVTNLPDNYCAASGGNLYGAIRAVDIGAISYFNDSPSAYNNHNLSTSVTKGSSEPLTIKLNVQSTDVEIAAWIDWNRDGSFTDDAENVFCGRITNLTEASVTENIAVPAWAATGKTKLRIRSKFYGNDCPDACGTTPNGTVEDFILNIIDGTPTVAPVADFIAENTTAAMNSPLRFTDKSTNLPQTWTWSVTPATFAYTGGTTASSPNPVILFTASGQYTIELAVSNTQGGDNETKINYITVSGQASHCPAATANGIIDIGRVQLNTLDNTSSMAGAPFYTDYSATKSTSLQVGQSYGLTISSNYPVQSTDLAAWIDFNNDGDFDDDGEKIGCQSDIPSSSYVFNFSVPGTSVSGLTKMRVRAAFQEQDCNSFLPCETTNYGEVEDYGINIISGSMVWTGATDTDWSKQTNWNPQSTPSNAFDLIIPATANQPVISSGAESAHNLTINNGASLTIAAGAFLTINGNLSNSGNFTLQSNSTDNGSVIVYGTITGNAVFQRYMTGHGGDDDAGWHLISSPVNANITINGSSWEPGASDDFYSWSETQNLWINHKASGGPSLIEPAKGYLVARQNAATGAFEGVLNNSSKNIAALSKDNGGWHLIGNPFPSAISWREPEADWNMTDIAGIAKVWNSQAGNYSDITIGNPVPATNGFFVQAISANAGFTIPATARVHSPVDNYKSTTTSNTLELRLSSHQNSYFDITRIGFSDAATTAWDPSVDALKLFGRESAPQLWTAMDDEAFSWNNLPQMNRPEFIPLHFKAGSNGLFKLEMTQNTLPIEMKEIYLEDVLNHQVVNFLQNPSYQFNGNIAETSKRFKLWFVQPNNTNPDDLNKPQVFVAAGKLHINYGKVRENSGWVSVRNMHGQTLYTQQTGRDAQLEIPFNLPAGAYMVVIQEAEGNWTMKVMRL